MATTFITAVTVPSLTAAEEIKLNSYDGSMRMTGQLLSYVDGIFELETSLGTLLVSAERVDCEGAGCPSPATVQRDMQDISAAAFSQSQMAICSIIGHVLDCEAAAVQIVKSP